MKRRRLDPIQRCENKRGGRASERGEKKKTTKSANDESLGAVKEMNESAVSAGNA